jgi:hydroxymethylpyrimidine pyrophosphatase-like HAD family hydrolase
LCVTNYLRLTLTALSVNHDLTIDPRVKTAIAAAQAAGIIVTLATGRMYGAALPFATALNIQQPLICYQGAVIRDAPSGHIRYAMTMPGAVTVEAVQMLLARDIFVRGISTKFCILPSVAPSSTSTSVIIPKEPKCACVTDLPAVVAQHPATKLLFVCRARHCADPRRAPTAVVDRLVTTRSHQLFGELTALGVSKGRALAD